MRPPPWPAPAASGPVDAVVRLPGSKSVTNRALVLGALATGTTHVRAPLRARDTALMVDALRALGVAVRDAGLDWVVEGGFLDGDTSVFLGNAGTVARFLPALAALRRGDAAFDGDPRMRERPVAPLLAALRSLGADVSGDAFPLVVRGSGSLRGGPVTVDASDSSQLLSGLLLAGPRMAHGLELWHEGGRVPSRGHVEMTLTMMRAFGASVTEGRHHWSVAPTGYTATAVDVEPDLSGAAPFLAAAVVTGGVVRVPHWPAWTTQPGAELPVLLERMGASWSLDASGLVLRGPSVVDPLDADLSDCGELVPVLAAVACVASGRSRLYGIRHLRLHETDRIAALATELRALGADVEEWADGLAITPRPLSGGVFATYDDHRLAMAAAVLGLVVPDLAVENVATVGKTMPDFVERWTTMLA